MAPSGLWVITVSTGLGLFLLIPIMFIILTSDLLPLNFPIIAPAISVFRPVAWQVIPRSGHADLITGSLRVIGIYGYSWSNIAYLNVNNAYNLYFNNVDTHPSYYFAHWYGFTTRCLVSLFYP